MKLITTILFLSTFTVLYAEDSKVENLETQIIAMAKELDTKDSKKIKAFLIKYWGDKNSNEEGREEEIKQKIDDDAVKYFIEKKKERLQNVLKHIQNVKPTTDKDKLIYKFQIDDKNIDKKEISFIYVKKSKIFKIIN